MEHTAIHPSPSMVAVSEEERFLFDLNGYLVVPDVLDADELTAINRLIDRQCAEHVDPEATQHRFMESSLLHWGKPMVDLIDHPRLRPYLREFLGDHARLDHDYADIIRRGHSPIGASLHGGNTPYDEICSYHVRDGRIHAGLLAVAFNLHDVPPGKGGFACVPGTHKSGYPLPSSWISLETPATAVRSVPGAAGSMIIFTEALTHGTLPWSADHERRTVFMKYSPCGISWHAATYQAQDYADLTERQRALLEGPNARYGGRKLGVR